MGMFLAGRFLLLFVDWSGVCRWFWMEGESLFKAHCSIITAILVSTEGVSDSVGELYIYLCYET